MIEKPLAAMSQSAPRLHFTLSLHICTVKCFFLKYLVLICWPVICVVLSEKVKNIILTHNCQAEPRSLTFIHTTKRNKQFKKANGYTHYKPKHLKRAIIWPRKGLTTKKKEKPRVSSAKNLQAYNGWVGGRSGSKNGNKKREKLQRIMWPRPPAHTSTQTPRYVWEKRFPLHSFLSQRKTTLIARKMIQFKVAQNSFQHIPRHRFWCIIITTLSIDATIMLSKNCPITGEHVGIIFVTQ